MLTYHHIMKTLKLLKMNLIHLSIMQMISIKHYQDLQNPTSDPYIAVEYKLSDGICTKTSELYTGTKADCDRLIQSYAEKQSPPKAITFAVYQLYDQSSVIPGAEAVKAAPNIIDPEMYHKVYEADYNIPIDIQNQTAVGNALNDLYMRFQDTLPSDFNGHRIAVGDVIVLDEKAYMVKEKGFSHVKNFIKTPAHSQELKSVSDKKELKKTNKPKIKR